MKIKKIEYHENCEIVLDCETKSEELWKQEWDDEISDYWAIDWLQRCSDEIHAVCRLWRNFEQI